MCQDSLDRQVQLILLCQDIRDIIPQGIVVNDHEVLAHPSELPKLSKIININFSLIGKQVGTSSKSNIGKVTNYAIDSSSMFIQKLYVTAPILRNFTGGNLIIDRSQIIEITTKKIIINDLEQRVPVNAAATA